MNQPSTGPKTPLGEPMTQDAALTRAQDRLGWHLKYWLNLYVIAIIRHHDKWAMAARISREQHQNIYWTATDPTNIYIDRGAWYAFKDNNEAEYFRYWESKTLEDEEYQAYVHDLERMLEDKEEKMREHLGHIIAVKQHLTGIAEEETDNWLNRVYLGLEQERIREAQAKDAEASNQVSKGKNSEHK